MSWIIFSICVAVVLLVSIFTEVRINMKDRKIALLTEHINDLEQAEELVIEKFNKYIVLIAQTHKKYLELSNYSDTLLKLLNKEVGEEQAEELILEALVTEQATDINQLFKDLVKDFTDDKDSDYTESEEESNVR